jgi:hypothetical protein
VALLYFGHCKRGFVEGLQGSFAGVGQANFDKGHVRKADTGCIQRGAVAGDHAGIFQPLYPRLGWRLGKADATGQFRGADAPFDSQYPQDGFIKAVKFGAGDWHVKSCMESRTD